MKVAPVSADLLIKLGLGLAVLGAAAFALYKLKGAAAQALPYVNPADGRNLVNQGVNSAGAAIFTDANAAGKNADGTWSLGGWLYDVTHPANVDQLRNLTTGETSQPAAGHYDAAGNFTGTW